MTRRRAREDLIRLYRAGLDHPWASRGSSYWMRSSEHDTLVLAAWHMLSRLDPEDVHARTRDLDAFLERLQEA